MSKLNMLKLLWLNLKLLKDKGQELNTTFDFLGEDKMVNYLFNVDSKLMEMLFLTLNLTGVNDIADLPGEITSIMPEFVDIYGEFMNNTFVNKSPKHTKKPVEKPVEVVKSVDVVDEDDDEVDDDKVDENDEEVEVDEVPVVETKSNKVKKSLKDVEINDDSDDDSDEEDSDEEAGDLLDTFFDEVLEEDEDSSLKLAEIEDKYKVWCKKGKHPHEDLLEYLTDKIGKPKGKTKKFSGIAFQ